MKKSFYNFTFQQDDGKIILYNARTNGMAELDKESGTAFLELSERELEKQNPEFARDLCANGFFIEDGVSEIDILKYDSLSVRYGNKVSDITIIPTMNCNFGCKYCYEKNIVENSKMDGETKDAIVRYIENNLHAEGKLIVTWYGGEPLLALDVIESLSKQFIKICETKNAQYEAMIVTNGYLLSEQAVNILKQCMVNKIQITLDGDRTTHNSRRPLINGNGTYSIIWNNILRLKNMHDGIKVFLRVNTDKLNYEAVEDVYNTIKEQGMDEFIYVYPGKVMAVDSCYNGEDCFSNAEFASIVREFNCRHIEERAEKLYPQKRYNACGADNKNSAIITYNGDIYKCWMDIGNDRKRIGNVKTLEYENEDVLHQYMLNTVFEDDDCRKCKYLPICMGGCLKAKFEGREHCTLLKNSMDEYMQYLPQLLQ